MIEELDAKKVLLVCDPTVYSLGIANDILSAIDGAGASAVTFTEVEPDPKVKTVDKCGELCKGENCDLVIVAGGGSAMDIAKGAAILATNGGSIHDYLAGRGEDIKEPVNPPIPLIAIPTTSGSGSEVSECIVIVDTNNIKDIMTGYRAFSYQFVKTFPVISKGFEIETEMTIHALDKNLSVQSVQVEYRDRPADSPSKLNTYSDGMKVLRTIVRLYKEYRPMSFFGLLAALMALVSVILFIPVFAEYLHTGLVPRFPTLIVCGVMLTMALLLWVCGLILDTVAKKHRQLFEINLNLLNGQRRRNPQ